MSVVRRCASPSWTAPAACWPPMTTTRSRGARRTSWRPRRWAQPRLLVVARRFGPRRHPGRHVAGGPLVDQRPGPAGPAALEHAPGHGDGQRRRDAVGAGARRRPAGGPVGPVRLSYLVDVQWPEPERIVLTVQSRDQRRLQVLAACVGDDPTITTSVLFEDSDDTWVELVHGAPAVLDDGRGRRDRRPRGRPPFGGGQRALTRPTCRCDRSWAWSADRCCSPPILLRMQPVSGSGGSATAPPPRLSWSIRGCTPDGAAAGRSWCGHPRSTASAA